MKEYAIVIQIPGREEPLTLATDNRARSRHVKFLFVENDIPVSVVRTAVREVSFAGDPSKKEKK